jgi:hypothetical protein
MSNKITNLDNLPNSLVKLNCRLNEISTLNNLPNSLIKLYCEDNEKINNLDFLPLNLRVLSCYSCNLSCVDNLPKLLEFLDVSFNNITSLDNLPNNLKKLIFQKGIRFNLYSNSDSNSDSDLDSDDESDNKIKLNNLPKSLIKFICSKDIFNYKKLLYKYNNKKNKSKLKKTCYFL